MRDIDPNHGYDSLDLDDRISEVLTETDNEADFHKWLDAALCIEHNRMRNTSEKLVDFEATYNISDRSFGSSPGYEIKLVIAEGGGSGTDYSGADVSWDFLSVHAEGIRRIPNIGEQVVEFVRQQNAEDKFPTREEMATALNKNKTDIHNALCRVQWQQKLVQPIPSAEGDRFKIVEDQPSDPATVFRNADTAGKKHLLMTTTDVYAVKAMLATLTHSGPLSPSSNVPHALHQILGDTTWPAVIGEASRILSKELGRMWAYSGD